MRIRGDNSDGFRNEENIGKALNLKFFKDLNVNLQHFLLDIFQGYDIKNKRIHAIRCGQRYKPDFYLHIDDIPKEVYISIKKGSGNSVHQEKLKDFLGALRELNAPANIIENLCLFHYGDDTIDGTGKLRYSSVTFRKKYPEKIKELNEYFQQPQVRNPLICRFVFKGNLPDAMEADYLYHGSVFSGVWASRNEIYDFIEKNSQRFIDSSNFNIGPLSYQTWNRNLKKKGDEDKRQSMQMKWGSLVDSLTQITANRKAYSQQQRGTLEGDLDEMTSVIFFNRNPHSSIFEKYLKKINIDPKKILLVRVTTNQYSKLSGKVVKTRADAYAIEILDNRIYDILEENEFYLDEEILSSYKEYYRVISNSGISIKISDSSDYQIIKLTPKSFYSLFGSYELGAGASLFCNGEEEIKKNIDLIGGWNSSIEAMQEYFKIFVINQHTLTNSLDLCKQIKSHASEKIEEEIEKSVEIREKIFNGIHIYEEPYTARFFMQNNKIKELKVIPYSITTGSGRSRGIYSIVLKPKK